MNTFYVRLLMAFMVANFVVLGVSILGTRALIDSRTRVEHDVDLDALYALVQQTYVRDGAEGLRTLNNKYRDRGLALILFENGKAPESQIPRPVRDFSGRLSFETRSTFELPVDGESLHSFPLSGKDIDEQTAVVVHQRRYTLDDRGPERIGRGPGRRPGGPEQRPDGPGRGPEGPGAKANDVLPGVTGTTVFVYLGLLMVGIALAGWIVARNLTAPLRSVQTTINRFANGDMSARVGGHLASRGDDMGRLAEDFDHMADGVEEMIRGRDRLLHHLSHEMRSPLARLRFAIELARGDQQQENTHLKRADREIDRLDALMSEMLQLARSESETLSSPRQKINLAELIADVVDRAVIDADAAGVKLEIKPGDNPDVFVYGDLLDRAIENVLRNAIKYTPEHGTVTISHHQAGSMIAIDILDEGPGVPASEHAALFEPFYRASNSAPGAGFGLGLSIVANIMRLHSGRVEVHNGERRGLLVRLKLPRA